MPNLEEMDEQEVHRFLTDLYSRLSPEEVYEANHPEDYVMEMPQSGASVRGREINDLRVTTSCPQTIFHLAE